MAGSRGVTLFVLLLSCWREARLQPVKIFSGRTTLTPSNLKILDENVAGVFDEILVQEILDPSNSSLLITQRPPPKPTAIMRKESVATKKSVKTDVRKDHGKEVSSGNEDRLFFNEEEKETIFQIKSLAALEKIIDNLRRTLGKTLKQKIKKHKYLFGKTKQLQRK
ncbi:sperm acrosome-associated protein 7 isoform X2 [Mustela erminea]|uniref:sperm acrosome-associated protein 7 isoform X2 n=1 Tax=Mustela erminea TaxID=36723 RepID=UPI001386FA2A|nr:sperm acrosome-associated protein 7 isoform X2 [Mustela erminea]